jgi:hypothetical protein
MVPKADLKKIPISNLKMTRTYLADIPCGYPAAGFYDLQRQIRINIERHRQAYISSYLRGFAREYSPMILWQMLP